MQRNNRLMIVLGLIMTCITALAPSMATAQFSERDLSMGDRGEDVKELQSALNRAGFITGAVDGVFGTKTKEAVMQLEAKKELTVDGIVDQLVIEALDLQNVSVSRGQTPERYRAVHDIVATAYAPGPHDNGKWGNLTHIGTTVRPGVIAVDPQVIPLGSRVYVEYSDGHGVYATAEDTGGAIKGQRIDIAMNSIKEAYNFGIQKVKVYVLD